MNCNPYNERCFEDGTAWLDRSRITFSKVSECHLENYQAPTNSIKYVIEGTEHYEMNGKKYPVGKGKFLLVNKDRPIDCFLQSSKPVIGFCIHLENELLQNVYTTAIQTDAWLLDHSHENLAVPDFNELLYSDQDCDLGRYLRYITRLFDVETKTIDLDEQELFQHLACSLLKLQHSMPAAGRSLDVLRSSTRNELFHRLEQAKLILDEHDRDFPDINSVAKSVFLSPAHFFRNFKKVYGVSPYQYSMHRKLKQAVSLMKTGKWSITDIALEYGFSDLPAFSKAFKKMYGKSPREFMLQNC